MSQIRQLPTLAEADKVEAPEQMVIEHWMLPRVNFHWWMVAYDPTGEEYLGYANLNDDPNAEWGMISKHELIDNCAVIDNNWVPKVFRHCVTDSLQTALLYPARPVRVIPITRVGAT